MMSLFFFFFKQKTAYEMRISDWSSDVCSSDLIVSGKIFHEERPEKMGYPIEGVEPEGGEGAEAGPSIATLLASADPAKGEAVFKKCVACHTVNQGGANGIGPNLYAVVGEEIGTGKAGFAFSDALKSKGGTWTFEALDQWLTSPRKFAPGTKMTFAGLGNPEDRANIIAYMNAQRSEEHTSELQSLMRISYAV